VCQLDRIDHILNQSTDPVPTEIQNLNIPQQINIYTSLISCFFLTLNLGKELILRIDMHVCVFWGLTTERLPHLGI
jgi:hypothetical protein